MTSTPSFQLGFARSASESARPALWKNLVGAWVPGLGMTGSQLFDVTGRGAHGVFSGGLGVSDWVQTATGPAIDFGTISQGYYVDINGLETWNTNRGSMLFRLRVDDYDSFGAILFGTNTDTTVYWQIASQGSVVQGGTGLANLSVIENDGLFHNIIMTSDGSLCRIWLDGQLHDSLTTSPVALSANRKSFALGKWIGGTDWDLDGAIEMCMAWSEPLTANQVQQIQTDPYIAFRKRRRVAFNRLAMPMAVHHLKMAGGL